MVTPPAPEPEPEPEPVVSVSLTADRATSVTTSSAVLKAQCVATVDNVSVSPTSVGFRYGTAELTNNVSCTADSAGNFTTTLTGLAHSTTYYWSAYAVVNGEEYKLANNRQFTTQTPTPEVTVTSVSYKDLSDGYAPTSERAYLSANYTATLDGAGLTPSAVGFCYGTTTTRDDATSVTVTQANLTAGSGSYYLWQYGLQPATTYYWWAWVEVEGTKHYTTSKQFTTAEVASATPVVNASWLELPAAMDGTSYQNATVWTVKNGSTRNYTIAYDASKYATYWVAYNLKSGHMGSLERPDDWNYDTSEGASATSKQVNLTKTYSTYNNGAGHAKGHMIPNASRNGNETMQKQTFYYTNSVPQIHNGFNNGIWQSLEAALQTIGKSEEIFIVTGTAFSKVGESKTISYTSTTSDSGKSIPVPNYFYKVVLKVDSTSSPKSAKAIGFWFENKAYSNSTYSEHTVSVDQIEKWTGLNFFVNLPDSIEEAAESNSSWSTFQSF